MHSHPWPRSPARRDTRGDFIERIGGIRAMERIKNDAALAAKIARNTALAVVF
jgi:hypothetical protein